MDQLTNLTVWDVKDVLNRVKNVVMNYTEMESKVREATNNEPWGASTTLMQEIAQGTYNYQYFNEIMPTIYKRFTEKEARQWRQIYKALVLLEYLVKNGCERVVDDARAHMATIKIMRNFSYIDEKGKDQGVNVRNRAKELAELLGDVAKIRNERKKARENRSKYTAISSEQYRYSQGGYGQGGGYNSSFGGLPERFGDGSFYERQSRSRYDYTETPDGSNTDSIGESQRESESKLSKRDENEPASPVANEVNLVNFEDGPTPTTHKSQSSVASIDDDFADFQVAPTSNRSSIPGPPSNTNASALQSTRLTSNTTATKSAQTGADLLGDIFGSIASGPASAPPPAPVTAPKPLAGNFGAPLTPTVPASNSVTTPTLISKQNESSGASATNDIWANAASLVSLDSLGSKPESKPAVGPSMNSLAQANSAAWTVQGSWASTTQPKPNTSNAPAATTQKPQDPADLLL